MRIYLVALVAIVAIVSILGVTDSNSLSNKIVKHDFAGNAFSVAAEKAAPRIINLSGWPKFAGTGIESGFGGGAVFADVDNDGQNEIIAGSRDGKIYVWHLNGNLMQGWPFTTGSYIHNAPAITDINKDGINEILVMSNDGYTYLLDSKGRNVPGWPIKTGTSYPHNGGSTGLPTPVIADINNDGIYEILVADSYYDSNLSLRISKLYILNYDGSNFGNWPLVTTDGITFIAVSDLRSNGQKQIIAAIHGNTNNTIHVYSLEKKLLKGWPVILENHWDQTLSMVIGDIDNDGIKEIIANCVWRIHALKYNGLYVSGWPFDHGGFGHDVILANMDSDIEPEIVFSSGLGQPKLYVLEKNASIKSGFPISPSSYPNRIAAADINNDGKIEIITGAGYPTNNLYAINGTGGYIDWFVLPSSGPSDSTPLIGDFDKDGYLEIAFGTYSNLAPNYFYIYKILSGKNSAIEWPMSMYDVIHSDTYLSEKFTPK